MSSLSAPRLLPNGSRCCDVGKPLCADCIEHFAAIYDDEQRSTARRRGTLRTGIHVQEDHMQDDDNYRPPNPYKDGLRKLRAASATEASIFENAWKVDRLADLAADRHECEMHIATTPRPRLTIAEAEEFKAPDPYSKGIRELQQHDARAREARNRR